MTDKLLSDIKAILDSYDFAQEALNFTPRSDNDIRAELIATAVREWEGGLVAALEPFGRYMDEHGDRDNYGYPLPDDNGVGWVNYALTVGDFRRARAALKDTK